MQQEATGAALRLESVGGQYFGTGVNCERFQGMHGPHIHILARLPFTLQGCRA
jgi:hypothetical protein